MYGITETTVHVTFHALQVSDSARSVSPIGRRLADLQIYLLDVYQRPASEADIQREMGRLR